MTFSRTCLLVYFLVLLIYYFFIFYLFYFAEPKRCYSSSSCEGNNLDVRFPFWLVKNNSSSCGYPGFNLYCTDRHETSLNLPNSGPFLVQEIKQQSIRLKDPENCLAKRLLTFEASKSPFSPLHLLNYTFLICPNEEDVKSFHYKPIHCLSNSTTFFFAVPSELMIPSSCQIFKTLLLPVSSLLSVDLNDQDLWLKWDSPDCTPCHGISPLCGFNDNTTLQVTCFEIGNIWLRTLKFFSISLSCVILVIGTYALLGRLCLIGAVRIAERVAVRVAEKKVELLRETKNVPWRNNDTLCPICLSEYENEDSVMSLLECEHCFHTDCINQWIKLHMSCPVCRNTPSSFHLSKIGVNQNVV